MKILSKPKGNAEEYGRWSVNPYIGCPHGCLYCYTKQGIWKNYLGQPKAILKKGIVSETHAYHLAMAEILENRELIIRDGGLFMSFTSDPMYKQCRKAFWPIIVSSVQEDVPVIVLTKSGNFWNCEEYYWLRSFTEQRSLVAFGWTLTGHDDLEPNAITNDQRIASMDIIGSEGFHVWASIEPVIDFDASFRMIQQALDAGCEHFKIGLMTKNTKVCRHGFTLGGKTFEPYNVGQLITFIKNVMKLTDGRATVYWKQSVADFLEGTDEKHPTRIYNRVQTMNEDATYGMTAREYLSQWPHSVPKDWNIFTPSPAVQ